MLLIATLTAVQAARGAETGSAPNAKVRVLAGSGAHGKEMWLNPGGGLRESFRDCSTCPEMVAVPSGQFLMGSPPSETDRWAFNEGQQTITFKHAFAAGKYAVTRGEFSAFVAATRRSTAGDCEVPDGIGTKADPRANWRSPGFEQTARHPAVCVTSEDAEAYTAWLSKKTGKNYRLLTDSEREYVGRAGSVTAYWWGDTIEPGQANYDSGVQGKAPRGTVRVDAFRPNSWGLYQVHGNVSEWVADCWDNITMAAPADGSPRPGLACTSLMHRGGGWRDHASALRSAFVGLPSNNAFSDVGFRVARDF